MTRVLLTGSSGFVGTAFRRILADREDVVADTIDIVGEPMGQPGPPGMFQVADIRDYLRDDNSSYDLVVHCAAVVGGRATIDGQPMAVATDLSIDAEFWQWVMHARPKTVVYFSSSAAYPVLLQTGVADRIRLDVDRMRMTSGPVQLREDDIDLDDVRQPDAIYGWVKLTGEQQARHVARELPDTRVLVVRPFSGYGPGQAYDYPVPSIVRRAVQHEDPIELWSNATRDFVYIDDVIGAVMAAVDRPELSTPGVPFTFNVASGVGYSFAQLADLTVRLVGYRAAVRFLSDMPTGVQHRVGDPTLMSTFYTPRLGLGDGIERMVQHEIRRQQALSIPRTVVYP